MSDADAKAQLAKLLERYTTGSVLHLLAELLRESADEARAVDDAVVFERLKTLEHTLFVVGLGVDSANGDRRVKWTHFGGVIGA